MTIVQFQGMRGVGFFRNVASDIRQRFQLFAGMLGVVVIAGSGVHLTDIVSHERKGVDALAQVGKRITECSVTFQLVGAGTSKETRTVDCEVGRLLLREHGSKKIDFRQSDFVTLQYRTKVGELIDSKVTAWDFHPNANGLVSVVYDPDKPSVVHPKLTSASVWSSINMILIGLACLALANLRRLMRFARGV